MSSSGLSKKLTRQDVFAVSELFEIRTAGSVQYAEPVPMYPTASPQNAAHHHRILSSSWFMFAVAIVIPAVLR